MVAFESQQIVTKTFSLLSQQLASSKTVQFRFGGPKVCFVVRYHNLKTCGPHYAHHTSLSSGVFKLDVAINRHERLYYDIVSTKLKE